MHAHGFDCKMDLVFIMSYEYVDEEQTTYTVSVEAGFLIETKEPVKESKIIEELTGLYFHDMELAIKDITGVYKRFGNGWVIYARVEIDLEAGEGDAAIEISLNNLEQFSTDFEVDKSTWYIETRFIEEETAEIVSEEAC